MNLGKSQFYGCDGTFRDTYIFLKNKYVNKKWANNDDWSHDPAQLFENKLKKF